MKYKIPYYRTRVSYNKILGEFIGTLEGVCAWDIPPELKERLQGKIKELEKFPLQVCKEMSRH